MGGGEVRYNFMFRHISRENLFFSILNYFGICETCFESPSQKVPGQQDSAAFFPISQATKIANPDAHITHIWRMNEILCSSANQIIRGSRAWKGSKISLLKIQVFL